MEASCWVQHRKYISVRGTKQICSTTLFQAKYIMLVSGPMEASTIWVEGNAWKAVPIVKKGLTCLLLSQNIGWADAHPAHPLPLDLACCDRRALHKPISLFSLSDPPTPTLRTKGQRSKARKCWCQWLQMLYATTPCTPNIVINVGSKIIFESIISVSKVSFLTTML